MSDYSRQYWTILNYSELYWIGLDYRGLTGINWTMVDYIELYLTEVDYTWLCKSISDYIVYLSIPEFMELYYPGLY